jgi:hypothetical protein
LTGVAPVPYPPHVEGFPSAFGSTFGVCSNGEPAATPVINPICCDPAECVNVPLDVLIKPLNDELIPARYEYWYASPPRPTELLTPIVAA